MPNVKHFKFEGRFNDTLDGLDAEMIRKEFDPMGTALTVTDITDEVKAMEKELQEWKDLHSQPWLFKEQDDA